MENNAMNGIAYGIGQFNKDHPVGCGKNGHLLYKMSSLMSQHPQDPWEPGLMIKYTNNWNGG
jgi:hypothetical protein